ncbi:sigma-70 family RNA polymerase sigma factor [Ponticaulis koreensis]|uniref:sigma-70 family RNA polymerase sigma factor n=1 Tax=Ponticaulis koreensis TaxID=1123045 RepID=UPI0003B64363|nr:sigma-70 family RNA polymerase sigma factor [Ponticaulis koreensis]
MRRTQNGIGLNMLLEPAKVEAARWRRFKANGNARDRSELFSEYQPFARKIAGSLFRARSHLGMEYGDFEQLAYAGLLEAMEAFDPSIGSRFHSFARHRIKGSISDGLIKANEKNAQLTYERQKERDRMNSLTSRDNASGSSLENTAEVAVSLALGLLLESAGIAYSGDSADTAADGFQSLAFRQLEHSVYEEVQKLPDPEDLVIMQHYIEGTAFVEIAKLLKLTKGRISQLHKTALNRLRKRLKHFL